VRDKKTIILVADVKGWAFDNIAQYILTLLKDKYDCYIVYTANLKNHEEFLGCLNSYPKVDCIHFFYRGYLTELLEVLARRRLDKNDPKLAKFLNAGTTTSVPDHLFIGDNNEILDKLMIFQFVDNYYPVSKKLYDIYYNITHYPKPSNVIYDNILIEEQEPNFTSNNDKLVVTWVGNSKWGEWRFKENYDAKGYKTIIEPTLDQIKSECINIEEYIIDAAKQKISKQKVLEILKKTDILLIASKIEGTPLPAIEAMAMACAIISTDVGIVPEILPQIQQEFIIKGDAKEFVEAIKKLNNNRELLTEIKKQNFAAYQTIFCNKSHFQNLWISLIEDSIKHLSKKNRLAEKVKILKTFNIIKKQRKFFDVKAILQQTIANKFVKKTAKYLLKYSFFKIIIRPIFKHITLQQNSGSFNESLIKYSLLNNEQKQKDNDIYVVYATLFPGVANSTTHLFNKVLPLPSSILTEYVGLPDKIITKMAKSLIEFKVKKLIMSGGGLVQVQLVEKLYEIKADNNIDIYFLWHGSPAQWVEPNHSETFNKWLNFYKQNKIKAIITLKKDLEKVLLVHNVQSYLLQNFIPNQPQKIITFGGTREFRIGLWSASRIWIKNLYPQFIALGMLKKNTTCYTNFQFNKYDSWIMQEVELKTFSENLPHEELMGLMGDTDLTLYVTNSECSPMIALESLSLGVPCLVGPTSGVYDDDEFLKKMLTVNRVDCPFVIFNAVENIRQNINIIKLALPSFIDKYNKNALALKDSLISSITS